MSAVEATDKTLQEDLDRLWDANDVAAFLRTSPSWVYAAAKSGRLECLRIGGVVRFDPAVIAAIVKRPVSKPPASTQPR